MIGARRCKLMKRGITVNESRRWADTQNRERGREREQRVQVKRKRRVPIILDQSSCGDHPKVARTSLAHTRAEELCVFGTFLRFVLFVCEPCHVARVGIKKGGFNLPQTECDEFCYVWRDAFVSICKMRVVSAQSNKALCRVFGRRY